MTGDLWRPGRGPRLLVMTSSNGNIFRVTGHLCGEFPGEFLGQRPVTRSFDVFFDLRVINGWVNNGEAGDLRRYRAHYDVTVMGCQLSNTWQSLRGGQCGLWPSKWEQYGVNHKKVAEMPNLSDAGRERLAYQRLPTMGTVRTTRGDSSCSILHLSTATEKRNGHWEAVRCLSCSTAGHGRGIASVWDTN